LFGNFVSRTSWSGLYATRERPRSGKVTVTLQREETLVIIK
jgi:hypothetical protein